MAGDKSNYSYDASVAAAAVAVSIWAIISATHLFQAFKYKTVYLIPLLIFVYLETLGYGTRIGAIKNPDPLWIIVVSETALVTAPAFLAAQYYMVIGRVMSFVGSEFSWIRHSRITKIFVAADVFAILTQATGGSMLASSDETDGMKRAKYILIIGLVIQVIVFGFFFFLAIFYDVRSSRAWRGKIAPATGSYGTKDVRPLWWAFYVGAVCLTVRSVYRTIEFASINFELGQDDPQGYLITHEWCLYVFDTLLILIAAASYNFCHPGAYLPRTKGPRMDGGFEEIPGRRRFLCCGARKPPKTMSTASSTSNIQMHTV